MSRRWLTVAVHECLRHALRKGFLLFTFGLPVLVVLVFVGIVVIGVVSQSGGERLGYVGRSGLLDGMPEKKEQGQTTLLRYQDEDAARSATQNSDLDGYFVVPGDYVSTGNITAYASGGLSESSQQAVGEFLRGALAQRAQAVSGERLREPVSGVGSFRRQPGRRGVRRLKFRVSPCPTSLASSTLWRCSPPALVCCRRWWRRRRTASWRFWGPR